MVGSFYDLVDLLYGVGILVDVMMLVDFVIYLFDDLLCKVDWILMVVSLEVCVLLLDWCVVEFVWLLLLGFKCSEMISKVLFKCVLGCYVLYLMVYCFKCGFGVLVSDWLKGDLWFWVEDLL